MNYIEKNVPQKIYLSVVLKRIFLFFVLSLKNLYGYNLCNYFVSGTERNRVSWKSNVQPATFLYTMCVICMCYSTVFFQPRSSNFIFCLCLTRTQVLLSKSTILDTFAFIVIIFCAIWFMLLLLPVALCALLRSIFIYSCFLRGSSHFASSWNLRILIANNVIL